MDVFVYLVVSPIHVVIPDCKQHVVEVPTNGFSRSQEIMCNNTIALIISYGVQEH